MRNPIIDIVAIIITYVVISYISEPFAIMASFIIALGLIFDLFLKPLQSTPQEIK